MDVKLDLSDVSILQVAVVLGREEEGERVVGCGGGRGRRDHPAAGRQEGRNLVFFFFSLRTAATLFNGR